MSTQCEYWKTVEGSMYTLTLEDPEGYYDAFVKWDGCIELTSYYNGPKHWEGRNPDDEDGIHICELDDLIKRLQALKEMAVQYFMAQGFKEWPGC